MRVLFVKLFAILVAFGAVCSLCFAYPILLPTDVNTILCWCLCLPFSIGIFAGCGHGLWVLGEEARAERERGSLEGPRIGDVVFYGALVRVSLIEWCVGVCVS